MGFINNLKGSFSEDFTNFLILGSGGYYKNISGAVFKLPNNKTFQIDILLITKAGFIIIENKNFNGWIFGSEKNLKWTTCYPNGKKNSFYNPIKQNKTHINMLQKLLLNRYEDEIFYNLIAFTTKCTLKKIEISSPNTYVEYTINASSRIDNIVKKNKERFSKTDVDKIYEYLNKRADYSSDGLSRHIKSIKKQD